MSTLNSLNSSSSTASQRQGEEASRGTNVYIAPYFPHQRNRVPGEYMVFFHPGYTLYKHFAFLGLEFEVHTPFQDWYGANLDDQLFNAISSFRNDFEDVQGSVCTVMATERFGGIKASDVEGTVNPTGMFAEMQDWKVIDLINRLRNERFSAKAEVRLG